MSIPRLLRKINRESFFTPQDFISSSKNKEILAGLKPLAGVILYYTSRISRYLDENYYCRRLDALRGCLHLLPCQNKDKEIAVFGMFGIGAPVAVAVAEEFIAIGAGKILNIGMAGCLQKDFDIGDLILCDKAIRDEGTSSHYLPDNKYVLPCSHLSRELSLKLQELGYEFNRGPTWTIDAPYRETADEIAEYQREGVLTVEMEAAAIFALAEYRRIQSASLFTISDILCAKNWAPGFLEGKVDRGLQKILEAAIKVLF